MDSLHSLAPGLHGFKAKGLESTRKHLFLIKNITVLDYVIFNGFSNLELTR